MSRRPRDAWRDQAGHTDERIDASGPDMWDPEIGADQRQLEREPRR